MWLDVARIKSSSFLIELEKEKKEKEKKEKEKEKMKNEILAKNANVT
jgi:hypothetical protein